MLSKNGFKPVLALVALLIAALACSVGGEDPTPTPEPAPANTAVSEAVESTEAPTEMPTEVPTEVPEPTATADPTEGFVSFTSEESGISLRYPSDWAIEELFFISLASSEELLADTTGMTEGAAMIIFSSPVSDYSSSSAADIINEAVAQFTADQPDAVVGEPQTLTINGQDAASVSVNASADDGTPLEGRLYAIVNGDYVGIVFAATPEGSAEEYLPLIEAVAGTVEVSEPSVAVEEPTGVDPVEEMFELRQWASSATASSQYGDPSWAAVQAAGERDTFECGDIGTAWAAESNDTVEWLELTYDTPVIPTQVILAQTYSPNQIVLIELRDVDGNYHELYSGEPEEQDCPYIMALTVNEDYFVDGIRITIDQTVLGTSWNEIDAVELVGMAAGDGTTPTQEEAAVPAEIPAGFLWRAGGESGVFEGEFAALGGMDTDAAGNIYVADNTHGLYVFDLAGNQLNVIDHSEFNNTTDVKVAPDGNLIVADWAANSIFVLSPDGEIITQFGEEGTGDGQFGTFSPDAVAVGPDGLIYAQDDNEDASGEDYERIQVFSPDGTFQYAFTIEEDLFSLSGMDFGPDGNLYVVGFIGDSAIIKYAPDGTLLDNIGQEALSFTGPQGLFIDDAGNFYVSTWSDTPVIKLDPEGNLVGTWGYQIEDDSVAWGEGGFDQAGGITGLGDGSIIIVNDWSGDFAFITAFSFVE